VCYQGGPQTPVSFAVRGGEIVGMVGLVGAGRTELAEALFGLRPLVRGEVRLDGRPLSIRSPGDAIAAGLLLAPEDRRQYGLGGLVFLLMYRNATPSSAGSLLELYAITGDVLGGCNLRGGEGTIPGIVLGAAVLPILQQICTYNISIGSDLEYTVVGGALLLATIANELVTRWSKRR
jgi:energy-coupling factor transporter ATP-binding protein EcfA2